MAMCSLTNTAIADINFHCLVKGRCELISSGTGALLIEQHGGEFNNFPESKIIDNCQGVKECGVRMYAFLDGYGAPLFLGEKTFLADKKEFVPTNTSDHDQFIVWARGKDISMQEKPQH